MGLFPGKMGLLPGEMGLLPGQSGGIVQRQRDYTIRDAMCISQRYENPNLEGYSYQSGGPSLDEYKESASNIRGYMEKTRNPLIKGLDLDFGESVSPIKSPPPTSAKGAANAGQPAPVAYAPMGQGYSRELMNSIVSAEARTLAKYRVDNPDTATLDIYSIGAESVAQPGVQSVKRSKIGTPSRGLEMGQPARESIGSKTLLGE